MVNFALERTSKGLEFTTTAGDLRETHIHLCDFNRASTKAKEILGARGLVIGPPLNGSANRDGLIRTLGVWTQRLD